MADHQRGCEPDAEAVPRCGRRIAELEKQLKGRPTEKVVETVEKRVEVPVLKDAHVARLEKTVETLRMVGDSMGQLGVELARALATTREAPRPVPPLRREARTPSSDNAESRKVRILPPRANGADLGSGECQVLTAIAQHPDGVTREQLTVLTGYKRSSRDTYLQRLGARGLIQKNGARILVTPDGIDLLGDDFEPLPTGAALRDYWMERLPEGERKILGVLLKAYPDEVTGEELSEATGYRRSSRDTYLQRLRARQLVVGRGRGAAVASDTLFV